MVRLVLTRIATCHVKPPPGYIKGELIDDANVSYLLPLAPDYPLPLSCCLHGGTNENKLLWSVIVLVVIIE